KVFFELIKINSGNCFIVHELILIAIVRIEIKDFRNMPMRTGNKIQSLVSHGKIKCLMINFNAFPINFFHR
ncbi:hypothetical protein HMPREF0519_1542, partial [Lentilactobacillus hilgardii DSM 20176 = ATCC 8290]